MHMARLLLLVAALLAGLSNTTFGQTSPVSEIAPGGKLRVGMIAITVLGGVAEPVAKFVGEKLGAAVEPVMYPNPEAYLQSFGKGEWDIAIGPRVLAPADKADSTANLWAISLVYVAALGIEFPDIASNRPNMEKAMIEWREDLECVQRTYAHFANEGALLTHQASPENPRTLG
jgi:polar amino acid transport system substrate-binding protein